MKKTGDAKPINVVSESTQDQEEGIYTRDFIHPWADKSTLKEVCKALDVPEEIGEKNVRVTVKVLP